MSAHQIALALGWEWVGQRDVGDMAPAWYDDYRTPDGRTVNTEPPYWQNAIAHEITSMRAELVGLREQLARQAPELVGYFRFVISDTPGVVGEVRSKHTGWESESDVPVYWYVGQTVATLRALSVPALPFDPDRDLLAGYVVPASTEMAFDTCAACGNPIFESLTWNHCGGTPPQDHQAEPAPPAEEEAS